MGGHDPFGYALSPDLIRVLGGDGSAMRIFGANRRQMARAGYSDAQDVVAISGLLYHFRELKRRNGDIIFATNDVWFRYRHLHMLRIKQC